MPLHVVRGQNPRWRLYVDGMPCAVFRNAWPRKLKGTLQDRELAQRSTRGQTDMNGPPPCASDVLYACTQHDRLDRKRPTFTDQRAIDIAEQQQWDAFANHGVG